MTLDKVSFCVKSKVMVADADSSEFDDERLNGALTIMVVEKCG